MYLLRTLNNTELIDLLVIHTNRLTQMMIFGESFTGEYDSCRYTVELLQREIFQRKGFCPGMMYNHRK